MDDGRNTLERVGEIALDKILDNDDVDLIAILGVRLPQCVSLSRPRDSSEGLVATINRGMLASPSDAVALFQEAHQNVRAGVARHASKLCIEDQCPDETMCESTVPKRVLKTLVLRVVSYVVCGLCLRMGCGMELTVVGGACYIPNHSFTKWCPPATRIPQWTSAPLEFVSHIHEGVGVLVHVMFVRPISSRREWGNRGHLTDSQTHSPS